VSWVCSFEKWVTPKEGIGQPADAATAGTARDVGIFGKLQSPDRWKSGFFARQFALHEPVMRNPGLKFKH
jgi:hypothetical protein